MLILCLGIFFLWPAGGSETEQVTSVKPQEEDGSSITPPPKPDNTVPPKKPKISWPWKKPDEKPPIKIPPRPTPVKPSEPGFFASVWNHIEQYWIQYACVFGVVLWYFWESPAAPPTTDQNNTGGHDPPIGIAVPEQPDRPADGKLTVPNDNKEDPDAVDSKPLEKCDGKTRDEILASIEADEQKVTNYCKGTIAANGNYAPFSYVCDRENQSWCNPLNAENECCPFKPSETVPWRDYSGPVPDKKPSTPITCKEDDKPPSLLSSIPIISSIVPNQDWYVKDSSDRCVGPGPYCMRCPSKAGHEDTGYEWTTPGQICHSG